MLNFLRKRRQSGETILFRICCSPARILQPPILTNWDNISSMLGARLPIPLRGGYGDALAEADWMFGEMVNHIEALKLQSNTLFLFVRTTDQLYGKSLGWGQLAHSVPTTHRIVMLVKVQHGGRHQNACVCLLAWTSSRAF